MPAPGKEVRVSANTHVDTREQQVKIIRDNPDTYLQVVKPYLKFGEEKDPEKHYPHARTAIEDMMARGIMVRDEMDALYVYNQVNLATGDEYLGVICNVSSGDYYEGKIKIHENTLTEKENQLIDHIRICGAIGEPVLLTHFDENNIEDLLQETITEQQPDIDFEDEINRRHLIYKVTDVGRIAKFRQAYRELSDFYIADGHHRSAASAGFYEKARGEHGHYLAFLVPAKHLHIDSFYRAFKSATEFNELTFADQLQHHFEISASQEPVIPSKAMEFGMRTAKGWYKLRFTGDLQGRDAVKSLDVSILEDFVFSDIFHIKDSKTDKQLTYIKGNTPLHSVEKDLDSGLYDLVFTVYPCDINQVFRIADEGLIMPPKSTYIEPKLRTGLTVQLV